jgi:beta-catenin-like protein 1
MFKLPLPKETPVEAAEAAEEDERFLGSGLSVQQQEIMDWVDGGEMAPSTVDVGTLKKLLVKLSKAIVSNEELRLKYSQAPESFAESEGLLALEIASLSKVSLVPHLYPQAISLGMLDKLLGLLAHENSDIVGAVLGVLDEWTGEDVLLGPGEDDNAVRPPDAQSISGMEALLEGLLERQGILETLVQTLSSRLNPDSEDDQQGLYHGLSLIENLIALDPTVSEEIVRKTSLLPWLLSRISQAFTSPTLSPVSVYAAEILAILLQDCQPNRERFASGMGVEVLLKTLSAYRKRDPIDDDETEFMENLFDALCSALSEAAVKTLFLQEEGLELMLLLMKQKKMARIRAVKVINHALLSPSGYALAHRWIEIMGLKTLFAAFMKKGIKDFKKTYKGFSEKEEEGMRCICFLASYCCCILTLRFAS